MEFLLFTLPIVFFYFFFRGINSTFTKGYKAIYILLSLIPFAPLFYRHKKYFTYKSDRRTFIGLFIGVSIVYSLFVGILSILALALYGEALTEDKPTPIEDPEVLLDRIDLPLKYWDYVHKQPKKNIIYAQHSFWGGPPDASENYTVVLYKNTKPNILKKKINSDIDIYENLFLRDDHHVYIAKQDSLFIPFIKGLYDENSKREEARRYDNETIIWDEEKRLLYYHVSWATY